MQFRELVSLVTSDIARRMVERGMYGSHRAVVDLDLEQLQALRELAEAVRDVQDAVLLRIEQRQGAEPPPRQVDLMHALGGLSRQGVLKRRRAARTRWNPDDGFPAWVADHTRRRDDQILRDAADVASSLAHVLRDGLYGRRSAPGTSSYGDQLQELARGLRELASVHPFVGADSIEPVLRNGDGSHYQTIRQELLGGLS